MAIVEIIRFRADRESYDALMAGRAAAVQALRDSFQLEHSTLAQLDDEHWIDVMQFPSAEAADSALEHEMELHDFSAWVAHVVEVVGRERAEVRGA